MCKVRFTMELWIHSHCETGQHLSFDIFNFTGEKIPADLIEYLLIGEGATRELEAFEALDAETAYAVKANAERADKTWFLEYESSTPYPPRARNVRETVRR